MWISHINITDIIMILKSKFKKKKRLLKEGKKGRNRGVVMSLQSVHALYKKYLPKVPSKCVLNHFIQALCIIHRAAFNIPPPSPFHPQVLPKPKVSPLHFFPYPTYDDASHILIASFFHQHFESSLYDICGWNRVFGVHSMLMNYIAILSRRDFTS